MDLITVGDVMFDVHVHAPALKRGGDVHGRVRLQPAGTSANAAVWAAWDGADVRVHGCVGDDLTGRLLREALAERGVDAALTTDDRRPIRGHARRRRGGGALDGRRPRGERAS